VRELVISHGRDGYVALYRVRAGTVVVLAVRHQREAGYQ
jgi:plasmid stabilization system protein ParE